MSKLEKYRINAKTLAAESPEFSNVASPFFSILQFVYDEDWQGACHACSAILYVLLRELNQEAVICLGELGRGDVVFDHSWVEVKGKIFDVAIAKPLRTEFESAPVFLGRDLETLSDPFWIYGTSSGIGDDPFVQMIKSGSFCDFMDAGPHHQNGLWHFVQKFGSRCGLKVNLKETRGKCSHVQWCFK